MNLRRHLAIQPRLVRASVLAGGFVAALTLSGCGDSRAPASASTPVPQHAVTACGTNSGRGCSSVRERVDLGTPSFSHSTEITNPLFPISRLRSAVLLGHVGGQPFRTETTLLPGTTTVAWAGLKVRVLLSQYLAYLNGRITEVALDRYAQADDGSVWYLGEDVFDYERGVVSATEGTWLAGREGPAAMIMPAHPQVGDVYRPENAPGIVFEEVTVKSVGKTLVGPSGPVGRAMIAHELHSDGSQEDKLFAPGYGEFRTAGDGDLEALALAVPADALAGRAPRELRALIVSARAILESARVEDWETASASLRRTKLPWGTLREGHLPQSISGRLSKTMRALTLAVRAHKPARVAQAAIDVEQSALDLQLRHRPVVEIDKRRFELWTQQLRVHAAGNDLAGATGDVAVLEWIRDRFVKTLEHGRREELAMRLRDLRRATDARNLPAAADHAARLAALLRA